jgi:hypothetical protein
MLIRATAKEKRSKKKDQRKVNDEFLNDQMRYVFND